MSIINKYAIALILVSLCACSNRDDFLLTEYQKSFSDIVGRKIEIEELKDINEHFEFTVLVLLNTECASCVLTAKRWSENIDAKMLKNKEVVFLSYGPPNEYFQYNFDEFMKSVHKLNHVQHESQRFIYNNDLELYSLDVFLLDKESKVLLVGDPTADPLIESFYMEF